MKVINLVVDKVIKAVMAVSGIVLLAVTFWQVVCRYVLKPGYNQAELYVSCILGSGLLCP